LVDFHKTESRRPPSPPRAPQEQIMLFLRGFFVFFAEKHKVVLLLLRVL